MIDRCARLSKLLFGRYVFAAMIDVYGNFLIIMAYNYTTITSIMLLDCFTIPVAMVLSYIFLGCQYNAYHMLGEHPRLPCFYLGELLVLQGFYMPSV